MEIGIGSFSLKSRYNVSDPIFGRYIIKSATIESYKRPLIVLFMYSEILNSKIDLIEIFI